MGMTKRPFFLQAGVLILHPALWRSLWWHCSFGSLLLMYLKWNCLAGCCLTFLWVLFFACSTMSRFIYFDLSKGHASIRSGWVLNFFACFVFRSTFYGTARVDGPVFMQPRCGRIC